ncbi:MAG: hypothetical protein HQ521_01575, partial [Bacteroidetes bacterium]|nr:hypothetical protein [Bacteroidota bacterium]
MNYLFIAPIPPPVNGQSLAAKTVYDNLIVENKIFLVDTSKQKRERTIKDYLNRLIEIFNILCRINSIYKYHHIDRVYLTLSESTQGNIKDIITFFLLRKVINKSIVHMFGGAGLKKLLLKNSIQSKLTKYYLSMVLKIIVEGQEQRKIFEEYNKQIFIVKNFVEEYLFVSEDDVRSKYDRHIGINILFLSNLIYGKGYKELLDGFINIGTDIRKKYHLTFVG